MKFHSPPILRVQSCLTDAVVVIFLDYCFTDTHLTAGAFVFGVNSTAKSFLKRYWDIMSEQGKSNSETRPTERQAGILAQKPISV